jgi:hypothetical protein
MNPEFFPRPKPRSDTVRIIDPTENQPEHNKHYRPGRLVLTQETASSNECASHDQTNNYEDEGSHQSLYSGIQSGISHQVAGIRGAILD